MITTVTLNPALDKVYSIANFGINKLFTIGDFNRLFRGEEIDTVSTQPGGKGINVALFCHKLSIKTMAMGIIGGHTGRMLEELLIREGLHINFLYGSGHTRTNLAIIDNKNASLTMINEPGDPILEEDLDTFKKKFSTSLDKSEIIVLAGSIPQGTDPEYYATLTEMALAKKKLVIINTAKDALESAIEAGPTIVFPDLRANSGLYDIQPGTDADYVKLIQTIFTKNQKIKTVILPHISESKIYFGQKEKIYTANLQDLAIVNQLGLTDQIIGGMVFGHISNWNELDCFAFAAAAGMANLESSSKLVANIKAINKCQSRITLNEPTS